ncbi:MAG TPA: carboxypeptidase-like regulatory domain-containing protein [Candidatus Thermoplasmatota archaeon]|nr:carboxypeptidase-like regulatory domain-containing protein [Candidatus Thermoplasmatota archaeon]
MRGVLISFLVVSIALAGCSGGKDEPPAPPPEEVAVQDLGLEATATTGIIRGLVVDEAIRPVANTTITLAGSKEGTTKSNADGAFGFDDLEPGTYFLRAEKLGFSQVQQSAEVVAGVSDPPIVKMLLVADLATTPFYDAYVFDGFIQCSFTLVAVSFAACSAPPIFTGLLCDQAGVCLGNVTEDNFGVRYTLARPPTWLQSEMVWESTQAFGGEMAVMYSWGCGDENGGFLCDHGAQGSSPVLVTANETEIAEINEGNLGNSTDEQLFVRVFNRGLQETDPGPGGGLGATLEQRFSIYSHFFYGYAPTEGWRFTQQSEVPGPPT